MKAFRVKFPATKVAPVMAFTVLATTPGAAEEKALAFARQGLDLPGFFAYGEVTPVTIQPGQKLASIIQ
jgi:hypothetical protein